jgi:uncharacterized protein (DUF2384 family)
MKTARQATAPRAAPAIRAAASGIRPLHAAEPSTPPFGLAWTSDQPVAEFARRFVEADPAARVQAERQGVPGALPKALADAIGVPAAVFFRMIGLPRATAARKHTDDAPVAGSAGIAVLGVLRLLGLAGAIVARSASAAARDFDTAAWFGRWIQSPHPALGGLPPADWLDTPSGIEAVGRVLGAMESGAYL